jgi:drug/metabolite transporter (DMT)-like permease
MSTPPRQPPLNPIIVLVFGILSVSMASIFIRYAQEYTPSLVIAAYRLLIAALVLAPIAFLRHRSEIGRLSRRDIKLALFSGFFLALHFGAWISSLEYTTVASSVVLVSTTPLWVGLLAPFTIREPLSRLIIIGLGLALIGGVIVGISNACSLDGFRISCPPTSVFFRGEAFTGNLLALSGALMGAAYILIGRSLRVKMKLIPYITLVYGMAAVVLVVLMLARGHSPFGYPPQAFLWFLLLALVPQLLGHSSFNWALGYLSAAYVSIALLGEPVGSTVLAFFLLQETPSILEIFGAILILSGIYVASRSEVKQKTPISGEKSTEKGPGGQQKVAPDDRQKDRR